MKNRSVDLETAISLRWASSNLNENKIINNKGEYLT